MRVLTLTSALILALAAVASAGTITLSVDNEGWNEPTWGDGESAPTSGNDYVVDGGSSADNTRINSATFAGDSLKVTNGGGIEAKQDGEANFIFDGGYLRNLDSGSEFSIGGTIDVQAGGGTLNAHKGGLLIEAPISGSGSLTVQDKDDIVKSYVRLNGGGSYSGTITVDLDVTGTDPLEGTFGLGASLPNASITFTDGLYDLSDSVSVLGFTIDGVTLSEGAYGAEDLTGAGVTSFVANGGTLTIVPEPTTMALLGLGGLVALRRRRRA